MGAETQMSVERRGYFPRGGGSVTLETRPATLKPLVIDHAGDLRHIAGIAHVANLPADIARRMSRSAADSLQGMGVPVQIDARTLGPDCRPGHGGRDRAVGENGTRPAGGRAGGAARRACRASRHRRRQRNCAPTLPATPPSTFMPATRC
ncbi:MAG: hypothetical protein MZW92_05470 [Comamonadaceae bacterium]|nr:hypothetical protein [Comamonadaceae bacterium]